MMWARNGLRVVGWGLGGLLGLHTAQASPMTHRPVRAPIALQLSPCLADVVDESELRRLLAIELGTPLRTRPGSSSSLQLLLDCSDGNPQLADLSLEDPATGSAAVRTVDLSLQAQAVRARLLALALAELVQTHSPDDRHVASPGHAAASPRSPRTPSGSAARTTTARPAQEPAKVPVSPPLTPPGEAPPVRGVPLKQPAGTGSVDVSLPALPSLLPQPSGLYVQAGLALLLPFALQPAPLHVGGGLRMGGDHRYHLGWDFDAQLQVARRRTPLGELSSDLLSSRASLQAHMALWALRLRAGLGLRVGAARLSGTPSDAAQASGQERWAPFGGPLLAGSITLAPASLRRLRIDLSAEGGYLLWSATARVDGKPALAIAGPWLGLSLSLGVSLARKRP